MKRDFLEGLNIGEDGAKLAPDLVTQIMSEYGKSIQAEQSKAQEKLKTELAARDSQISELTDKIKGVEGLDEKSKAEIAKISEAHNSTVQKMQTEYQAELQKLSREAATRDYFDTLPNKFVTPETRKAFEAQVNAALVDPSFEGKNRGDIFEALTKDRSDIYQTTATTAKPTATGATGTTPAPDVAKYSIEQIKKMSPSEINANWDAVQTSMILASKQT